MSNTVITDYGRQRMMLDLSLDAFETAQERGLDEVAIMNLADAIIAAEKLKSERA